MKPDRAGQTFSDAELASIIGRSSTLAERLAGEVVPTGQGWARAAKRLDHWKHLAAGGDDDAFRRSLGGWRAASNEELSRLLGEVEPVADSALPRWAAALREITGAISAAFADGEKNRRPRCPVPFAPLYAPVVAWARREAESMTPALSGRLCDAAWGGLENWLLRRLSAVCSLALQPRFLAFKAVRRAGASLARFEENPRAPQTTGTASFFDAFVREQGRRGLRGFFLEYPTAARLCAQTVLFWVDFVAEFLGRLEGDADEISARFLERRPVGKIVRVEAGLSDSHRGGRSVLVLGFETGLHLVYKPRPMEIDAAFNALLSWSNAQGRLPSLPAPTILTRPHYGWESFVAHSPCRDRRAGREYFRRAGVLLYLTHALRGIDFHRENLIATAGGPVLVDLEALCHPPLPGAVVLEDAEGKRWPYDASVFRTGMLPLPGRRPDGGRFSKLSALAGSILQRSPATDIRWNNVNSDRMEAAQGSARMVCATHRPRLRGRLLPIREHGGELADGFRRAARFFRDDPHAAARWRAAVAAMRELEVRRINRPTLLYALMIGRSLQPRFLVEGIDRSIEFQALPPTAGDEPDRPAELAALEVLDVPVFFGKPAADQSEIGADPATQSAAIRASVGGRWQVRRAIG